MSERYHRSQLLLEPDQHDRLRQIARREGRSISDVAREAIRLGLKALARDQAARARRRAHALEHLAEIRAAAQEAFGVYERDLMAEVRFERERELERAQGSGS